MAAMIRFHSLLLAARSAAGRVSSCSRSRRASRQRTQIRERYGHERRALAGSSGADRRRNSRIKLWTNCKLKPGMVVADIGAGVGYMSLKMARRIGPNGKVYANDIQPEMLAKMREKHGQGKDHERRAGAGRI